MNNSSSNEPSSPTPPLPVAVEEDVISSLEPQQQPIPTGARRARLMGRKSYFEGYVLDEHYYVQDVVSSGVSQCALTGPPQYTPIPLAKIRAKGHTLDFYEGMDEN